MRTENGRAPAAIFDGPGAAKQCHPAPVHLDRLRQSAGAVFLPGVTVELQAPSGFASDNVSAAKLYSEVSADGGISAGDAAAFPVCGGDCAASDATTQLSGLARRDRWNRSGRRRDCGAGTLRKGGAATKHLFDSTNIFAILTIFTCSNLQFVNLNYYRTRRQRHPAA
ncbi:hypothetical protein K9U39_01535 [Rhodoblastus acidophilus]|uniref:Uncharacterized protein n=1 Tax=Candidatus Rhodoblastus alkanivorans TaxID=2954117 RepID=A0ABS9Z3T3_9HYPH|nr:hypothetical protein [Candidatus Rhodoblastus alkanivorans]MCI4679948.1 hypothetical protein [Candidatus Rhodoblastus alkanivorans]MCI4682331.1 hypothetical protein [Candidatus Rhodoblastus alkanivorans]MDI4639634.1 hypothetical protein [Rhodoblastus acidophilus]